MADVFDSLLPIATLLLGAGLANFLKFSELRKNLRLDAADQLAELPAMLWNKEDPEGWLKLNSAVSRLSIRLNLAGVHPDLSERIGTTAITFWENVHVVGRENGEDIWLVSDGAHETWVESSEIVAELLGTNSRIKVWWISRRARKLLKKWDEQEKALVASVKRQG